MQHEQQAFDREHKAHRTSRGYPRYPAAAFSRR
jgi:hypothetical protein